MVHYKLQCGVSVGRDLVYKGMEGLWSYITPCFICDVYIYVVLAVGVIGVGGEDGWCGVVSTVSRGGEEADVHNGLPGRLCGRHKTAAYLLPAADVMW